MTLRLLLLMVAAASAQTAEQKVDPNALADSPQIVAWKILARDGVKPENIHEFAKTRLINGQRYSPRAEPIYDYQRVEVTGIWSKDDSDDTFPGLFDKQIKPATERAKACATYAASA